MRVSIDNLEVTPMSKNQNKEQTQPEEKKELVDPVKDGTAAIPGTLVGGLQGAEPLEPTDGDEPNVEASSYFAIAVSLADLATAKGEANPAPLYDLLAGARTEGAVPEGFPEALVLEQAIARYIAQANTAGIPLEQIDVVVADPAADPVLKALNFMRALQGLGETVFYPQPL